MELAEVIGGFVVKDSLVVMAVAVVIEVFVNVAALVVLEALADIVPFMINCVGDVLVVMRNVGIIVGLALSLAVVVLEDAVVVVAVNVALADMAVKLSIWVFTVM